MVEWGWRIPFLLVSPLGIAFHFYIKLKLDDSPAYQQMESATLLIRSRASHSLVFRNTASACFPALRHDGQLRGFYWF
ncbi:MAG: hypothetical protein ACLT98_10890 [Eggerthellaceae bacterium]